jgi:hypothetical protein
LKMLLIKLNQLLVFLTMMKLLPLLSKLRNKTTVSSTTSTCWTLKQTNWKKATNVLTIKLIKFFKDVQWVTRKRKT